jgi:DNA-binding beta-propeller fold protein YncE
VFEPTESFNFNLSSATGATIADGTGVVTITDNDATTPPPVNPAVVAIRNTTLYKAGDPSGYGCSDPSGLAYVPGLDLIFIADSEHEESPFFSPTNLFAVRPDGTHVASYSLTSFCKEPTGLAYNPKNGYLYITDDDQKKVFWVDPEKPSVKIGEFSVKPLGIADAEDPKFDPVTGHMYMLNGLSKTSADNTLFELTNTGQLVRSVKLPSPITDAEALAYDSPNDVFYVASGATRGTIFQVSGEGQLLATIDLLNQATYRNEINGGKPKIKGLDLAPSSNPNDGNKLSLYAADYGADQVSDGRLIEIDLGYGWFTV